MNKLTTARISACVSTLASASSSQQGQARSGVKSVKQYSLVQARAGHRGTGKITVHILKGYWIRNTELRVQFRQEIGVCRVQSVECREKRVECKVYSVKCRVESLQFEVQSVECNMQNIDCRVSSVEFIMKICKCRVSTVQSVKFRVVILSLECRIQSVEC